jgi:hypothetical protein
MFLYPFLRINWKKDKGTLLAVKAAPLQGGELQYIPPLRGDSGGCAFLGFFSLFTHTFIFRIDRHAALQHQMRMKILTQESFPPLAKGVRGI